MGASFLAIFMGLLLEGSRSAPSSIEGTLLASEEWEARDPVLNSETGGSYHQTCDEISILP